MVSPSNGSSEMRLRKERTEPSHRGWQIEFRVRTRLSSMDGQIFGVFFCLLSLSPIALVSSFSLAVLIKLLMFVSKLAAIRNVAIDKKN